MDNIDFGEQLFSRYCRFLPLGPLIMGNKKSRRLAVDDLSHIQVGNLLTYWHGMKNRKQKFKRMFVEKTKRKL